jgi:hypothetical protein
MAMPRGTAAAAIWRKVAIMILSFPPNGLTGGKKLVAGLAFAPLLA